MAQQLRTCVLPRGSEGGAAAEDFSGFCAPSASTPGVGTPVHSDGLDGWMVGCWLDGWMDGMDGWPGCLAAGLLACLAAWLPACLPACLLTYVCTIYLHILLYKYIFMLAYPVRTKHHESD